jgi:hypothetical protein
LRQLEREKVVEATRARRLEIFRVEVTRRAARAMGTTGTVRAARSEMII